jgi:aspartate ammonia-lyase
MERVEHDFIGTKMIPEDALYGIHAVRARENFPFSDPFDVDWYASVGTVKLACYQTYRLLHEAIAAKYGEKPPIPLMDKTVMEALIKAAAEVANRHHFEWFITPSTQGGAGTSINMNINEIIANRALQILGEKPGDYDLIDPIEHANIYQSTNDVIPTALKICTMQLLKTLEASINELRHNIEIKEREGRDCIRIGYTQMQAAVPSSYGKLFASYSEALSRDWWRVSKCFERIKVVNIGGSAIGTGISVPRFFIMEVIGQLQSITKLPVTRSENMADATSNLDSFVEVHAILKSLAVNLEKISSDIRLLASDVVGEKELTIPARQVGSSIMPGKVNPVIAEYCITVAHKVYANDQLISGLSALGCLELNAYLPEIGNAVISSIKMLSKACESLSEFLIKGIVFNSTVSMQKLYRSPAITTVLLPHVGYHHATLLSKEMQSSGATIFEANEKLKIIDNETLKRLTQPDYLLQLGFSLNDLNL